MGKKDWKAKAKALQHELKALRAETPAKDAAPAKPAKAEKPRKQASRDEVLAMRAEVRKCEERLGKLNEMRDKLATKLADPALYEDARKGELEVWNRKYAEVMEGLDRAEALWLTAQEKLESATA